MTADAAGDLTLFGKVATPLQTPSTPACVYSPAACVFVCVCVCAPLLLTPTLACAHCVYSSGAHPQIVSVCVSVLTRQCEHAVHNVVLPAGVHQGLAGVWPACRGAKDVGAGEQRE